MAGAKGPTAPNVQAANTKMYHNIFLGLAFELIGISLLAVLADLNDELGKLMVTLMAGWFIIFLSVNSPWLATVVPGAKNVTNVNPKSQIPWS